MGCSSYHAGLGSRTAILEQWRQRGGLIVCTSALGVGVDIAGVEFTLHIEQLWSMIDFVQESGRARGQGKAVVLAVAEEERRQRAQQRAQRVRQKQQADEADEVDEADETEIEIETETETEIETETETDESEEMDDSQAVARLIRTRGCRRRAISRYMDGTEASCRQLEEVATADQVVAWCDNCNRRRAGSTQEAIQQEAVVEATTTTADTSGQEAWQADAQLQAVQERVVRAKLNELAQ